MENDLIYDVGLHKGEDTAYYLKRGFRVIGFEANPDLVAMNQARFAVEIAEQRLRIVSGAIVSDCAGDSVEFYRNLDETAWGTTVSTWAQRNETLGTRNEVISVPAVDFRACLKQFGTPYYMKIDIEGADGVCLEVLREHSEVPRYISLESEKTNFDKLIREIEMLSSLGYTEFAAVQQAQMFRRRIPSNSREGRMVVHRFPRGSSGLFGQDITGWVSKADIVEKYGEIFALYERFGDSSKWRRSKLARTMLDAYSLVFSHPLPGWYDTHARRP